ncbi:MAG: DUF2723 domain-containing protein [bacterium]
MMRGLFRPVSVVFLLSFAIYLFFLCPDIAWDDSGEFVTASSCLGVPHAPGSPWLVILGKRITCMPLGSVAFRVNLLSALTTSLSACLLCFLIQRMMTASRHGGAIAATLSLAWAVSPWVMRHALAAEVYGLAWMCLLAGFVLTDESLRRDLRGPCSLYILWGLVAGIGVSTSVLLIPFALLLCIVPFVDRRGWWAPASRLMAGLSLGLLPLALPLLRSADPPPLYYSGAATASGFAKYLLGQQFERQIFVSTPRIESSGLLWVGLGFLALVFLLKRSQKPRRMLWIAGIGGLNLLFILLHRHPGHFFVPWLTSALLTAASAWPVRAGRTIAVGCLVAAGIWSYQTPLRTQDIPLRWVERSARAIPPNSIAFLGEINATFPHFYSAVVQRDPDDFTIHPVWNATRAERLQEVTEAAGTVFVDIDLVDYSTRTQQTEDPFSSAVADPILLNNSPPDVLTWETWWDSERAWLRENQPRMSPLDRVVLGTHYFNLGVFCLEREIPVADALLGTARGLNPELPDIGLDE